MKITIDLKDSTRVCHGLIQEEGKHLVTLYKVDIKTLEVNNFNHTLFHAKHKGSKHLMSQ